MTYDLKSEIMTQLPSPFRSLHLVERKPDFKMELHSHTFYHLMAVTSGTLYITFNEQEYCIQKGQFLLLPPNIPHALSSPQGYSQVGIDIYDTGDPRGICDLLHKAFPSGFAIVTPAAFPSTFSSLFHTMHNQTPFNTLKLLNYVEAFLIAFLENSYCTRNTSFRQNFLDMLSQAGGINLTVPQMCNRLHMSKTHFERLMQSEFGCGAAEYCKRQKLMKACTLLQDTDVPINMIAQMLDFNTPGHFSSFFKLRMDVSPREFRISSRKMVTPTQSTAKGHHEKAPARN